ncbi:MAG: hypothetical protein ACMXYM_00825 [Candidatus Woesearchaeota archaeon]
MKRSDPHLVTYILVFLLIYTLVTGMLIFVLRGIVLDERLERQERLSARTALLEAEMRQRSFQEQRVIEELITTAGARDFEEAYAMVRDEIEELRVQRSEAEERATTERDAWLEIRRERDDVVSRVQALELITERMRANLNACLVSVAECSGC